MIKRTLIITMMIVLGLGLVFTSAVNAAGPPEQEEGREYVIQTDDWLSRLAKKYLGDGNLWPQIVEATNAQAVIDSRVSIIRNPNVIYPGQIIFIPTTSPMLSEVIEPRLDASPQPFNPHRADPIVSEVIESGLEAPGLGVLCQDQHPAVQAFCSEIPIAQIHLAPYEKAEFFTCAGRAGLGSVQIDPNAVTILIPNDGDFDLRGIVVSIKLAPDNATLIPRWPGSKFDFSAEYARKFNLPVGEQLKIPLSKAFQLIKAGEIIWTGQHGEPGKAGLFQTNPPLTCDPQADFEIVIGPL